MALLFTDVFLDIISKHIPNKIITCSDKDAPWTPLVKTAIKVFGARHWLSPFISIFPTFWIC